MAAANSSATAATCVVANVSTQTPEYSQIDSSLIAWTPDSWICPLLKLGSDNQSLYGQLRPPKGTFVAFAQDGSTPSADRLVG